MIRERKMLLKRSSILMRKGHPYIKIDGKRYYFAKGVFNRFLAANDIKDFWIVKDDEEKEKKIKKLLPRKVDLMYDTDKKIILRFCSEVYCSFNNEEIVSLIDEALKNRGVRAEKVLRTFDEIYLDGWWILKANGDSADQGLLWCLNRNDGYTSFKLVSGVINRICMNGLVDLSNKEVERIYHVYGEKEKDDLILMAVDYHLNNIKSHLSLAKKAKEQSLSLEEQEEFVEKNMIMAEYVEDMVKKRIKEEHQENVYGLSQALSYVANNCKFKLKKGKMSFYRAFLSHVAYEVMKDYERASKKIFNIFPFKRYAY